LDRQRNSEGLRRKRAPSSEPEVSNLPSPLPGELPPLLQKLMAEYAASGLPPAYLVDWEGQLEMFSDSETKIATDPNSKEGIQS
jgi:hypothetical protein